MDFENSTTLSTARLLALVRESLVGWNVGSIVVRVRYSRGADFSGTCLYAGRRIYVNLGHHVTYPYHMATHVAPARTVGRNWIKPECRIELRNGYDLVLFIFLHELYHLLVKLAGRNTRQKESMCDRFAARWLVDRFGAVVRDGEGRLVARAVWDFQDLDGFVAAARDRRVRPARAASRQRAAARAADRPTGTPPLGSPRVRPADDSQFLLFPL